MWQEALHVLLDPSHENPERYDPNSPDFVSREPGQENRGTGEPRVSCSGSGDRIHEEGLNFVCRWDSSECVAIPREIK